MKLVRTIAFSLSVAGASGALVFACGGTVEHAPQTSATAATKAPLTTNAHGVVRIIGDALAEVPLRAHQRTEVEKLAQEAEARHAPMAEGRKELMLAFADQVEQGVVDKGALQPKIDRVMGELEKARIDDRAALTKLHALLDSDQRNAFVDALEHQMKAKRGDHHDPMMGFARMKQLSDDLKLTDEQRSKIHELMRDAFKDGVKQHGEKGASPSGWHGPHHGGAHHGGKKAFEAFRSDKLDLDKVAPPHDVKATASLGTDRAAKVADKVLPILTPEQRKIAADKLRAMAASGDASFLGH